MPSSHTQRLRSTLLLSALLILPAAAAFAATSITGTVTDRTTGKPAAGDDVTLIRLQQTMEETTHTKTDAHGRFTLPVPDDGMHLVRVTHDKANYFQPATADTHILNLDVYDAAAQIEGITTGVEELHVEASATELHIVEVLQVLNQSSPARTQFGPKGFDFYVQPEARIIRSGAQRDGMPVPTTATPVGDPGHYTFLFPIRPGETQFGIFYTMPYTGRHTLTLKLPNPVNTVAIVLPRGMKFEAGSKSSWAPANAPNQDPNTQTWTIDHASPSQSLEFTVSGTGTLPTPSETQAQPGAQAGAAATTQTGSTGQPVPETQNTAPGRGLQNPLDPEGDRDTLGKYKWWILGALALLLAAAAGILLRKPRHGDTRGGLSPDGPDTSRHPGSPLLAAGSPAAGNPAPHSPANTMDALKEELFSLETDHLQARISEREYIEHKAALELVLRRALNRHTPPSLIAAPAPLASAAAPTAPTGATYAPQAEPASQPQEELTR